MWWKSANEISMACRASMLLTFGVRCLMTYYAVAKRIPSVIHNKISVHLQDSTFFLCYILQCHIWLGNSRTTQSQFIDLEVHHLTSHLHKDAISRTRPPRILDRLNDDSSAVIIHNAINLLSQLFNIVSQRRPIISFARLSSRRTSEKIHRAK